jgi:hypothetical protein
MPNFKLRLVNGTDQIVRVEVPSGKNVTDVLKDAAQNGFLADGNSTVFVPWSSIVTITMQG